MLIIIATPDPVKSQGSILRGINRVVWGPILFYYTSAPFM